jgi:hypothetical protein
VKRALAAVAGALASVVVAAPASAFSPPELFVRLQPWNTHEAVSDWIPLASAPVLNYLGGYQVGYRLQASGQPNEFQRAALAVAGVPDGVPTQPSASPPYCVGRAGAVGSIVEAGPELQFEGDGRYTVTVSVGAGLDCQSAGASTTASFDVDVHVAPALVGEPLSFRSVAQPGAPFVGVQAPEPPGGQPDVRCALDGAVQPDGSVTGSVVVPDPSFTHASVIEKVFTRPGVWACVARGTVEGLDGNRDTALFSTPWSAPLSVDVRSDFRRRTGTISQPRAKRVRLTFVAEWPAFAGGGRGTVTLSRVTGCRGANYKLRKVAAASGRFDAKRMRLTLTRPRVAGFYLGRFAFSGTRFLRAGDDPNPMLMLARRNRFGYSDPKAFARCPGYRP